MSHAGLGEKRRRELATLLDRIFDSSSKARVAFNRLVRRGCDRYGFAEAME
jgi:hypothetical protein